MRSNGPSRLFPSENFSFSMAPTYFIRNSAQVSELLLLCPKGERKIVTVRLQKKYLHYSVPSIPSQI